ncbi:hypothetical protein D9619_003958 [Psilocybe cf. subviscida]|uniref:Uncharacterized protein n=1 Tax=Psilocybe cf. subviscida TaxID=2480587 RepID=A0A8H5BRT8_9AGAR|nr:hypothetical protein D9619_003958 [Psilocybe cf. subviscida]
MEDSKLGDCDLHQLHSSNSSASDRDMTLVEQEAHLRGSTQSYHQSSPFFDPLDSVLCATLLGSGAFADDKSYYCGLSPMNTNIAVEEMTQFWDVPIDLSEYLPCPKAAPSSELEIDPHDHQMDSMDAPERENTNPLFSASSTYQNESLAFDVTPPSLRRVQKQLAMRNFSASPSNMPDVFNFNALGITPWLPSQEIQNYTPPWTETRALEFRPMFYSPESGAKLSIMRASGTYSYGPTYTPSLASSDDAGTPPIDSMIKQKLAAQDRRPAAPSARVTSPPSPWFPRHTGRSPASSSSSLSRQLFEKLLRESSSPRPAAGSAQFKENAVASSNGALSGFFSPDLGTHTSLLPFSRAKAASLNVKKDCTESVHEEGDTTRTGSNERRISIPSSASADSALFRRLRHGTTNDDLTVKPPSKETRTIAIQTDCVPVAPPTQADETVSAIRIVALKPMQSLVSHIILADRADVGNLTVDAICPGSFPAETSCDEDVKEILQGSIIGRAVRFVLGW